MFWKRVAALAEVLLVLALGNLIGEVIFGQLAPPAVLDGTADDMTRSIYDGLLILLRLGLAGGFGLALLYLRRGITPRRAGLSRNGQPLAQLLRQGLGLGLFSGFLVSGLFALHALIPLGAGLEAWWTYDETPINGAFWVYVLGTSVLIPPLAEEVMARGYFRVRLVESYGVMAGVVLAALVFGLSHTRYLAADGMLLLFMLVILVNSTGWTYLAQKTGSIIPSLVAHGLSNGIGTWVLFDTWTPFVVVTVGVVLLHRPMLKTMAEFLADWRADQERTSLWQGIAIVLAILVSALTLLSLLGRTPTLIALGGFCLVVTVVELIRTTRTRA